MRSLSFPIACLLLAVQTSSAQTVEDGFRCGANEQPALLDRIAADPAVLQNAMEAKARSGERTGGSLRSSYTIPIVFHIIHNNGVENISDAQIEDAVRILNEDFNNMNPSTANVHPAFEDLVADVGIEFQLARLDPEGNCTNGITRTVSTQTYEGDFAMTQLIQWPRNNYLNVWVAASANGAAGYTYYPYWLDDWPEADGIVILHSYTGSMGTSSVTRSHVLTHEVGHWLNLAHCWGNSNDPGDEENCNMDDGVADTPLTKGWTGCSVNGASCGSPLDNVENYMEYSYCYKMFTIGQADRMLVSLNSPIAQRNELWQPFNLQITGLNEGPALCEVRMSHGRTEICAGSSIQFSDDSFHSVTERTWSFPGGTPSTSNAIDPVVTYDEPGSYPVILEVSDGNTTLVSTQEALVHVFADPGMPVPFFEGSEDMTTLPSDGWWVKNPDGDTGFMITDDAAYSGSRSVMITNGSGAAGHTDELRSPSLDLEGASGLSISFQYAYAQRSAANDDRLRVMFSVDCSVNWSVRKQLRPSNGLVTAAMRQEPFVPEHHGEWGMAVIDIPISTFYVSQLLMKFEFRSDGGNNLYIDDINIHGTPVWIENIVDDPSDGIQLLNDPANDRFELVFDQKLNAFTRIALRDVLGRELNVVLNRSMAPGTHRISIPLAGLPAGIYLVEIQRGNDHRILRSIKE